MKINFESYPGSAAIPHGTLKTFETTMHPYPDERTRTIRVWLPEGYDGKRRFPVVYMHDAQNLFRGLDDRKKWDADLAAVSLAKDGIECIIVGVDTAPTRFSELQPPFTHETEHPLGSKMGMPIILPEPSGDLYDRFITEYLKPMIDENLMTLPDRENTCIGGSSMGGLQSFYMAMMHPDVYGRAICFSPAFPVFPLEEIMDLINGYDMSRLEGSRFFFYDGGQALDREIIAPTLAVYLRLEELGMGPTSNAFILDSREPHYETAWAKYLPEALRFLFLEDNSVPTPPPPPPRGSAAPKK